MQYGRKQSSKLYWKKKKIIKINTNRNRAIALILGVFLIGGLFLSVSYGVKKIEWIHTQQQWLDSVISIEKRWILDNQGPDGEIYMNGHQEGDVNPYFSCIAALGLLSETKTLPVSQEELTAVSRYLNWHTEKLLETEGKMGIYQIKDREIIRTETADSEDAYLGLYLQLMGRYLKITGSADQLVSWEDGVDLALRRIRILRKEGTMQVSEENPTVYLMDNLEVWRGLYEFENSGFADDKDIKLLRQQLEERIQEVFWDKNRQKWKITIDNDNYDKTVLYPDGIAQIYPLIYEFPTDKEQKLLYQEFCENFKWQELNKDCNGFAWTMTGMAASVVRDSENLQTLIENYEITYKSDRKYPLYTGEAGWICQECEKLYQMYEIFPFS